MRATCETSPAPTARVRLRRSPPPPLWNLCVARAADAPEDRATVEQAEKPWRARNHPSDECGAGEMEKNDGSLYPGYPGEHAAKQQPRGRPGAGGCPAIPDKPPRAARSFRAQGWEPAVGARHASPPNTNFYGRPGPARIFGVK